MGLKPAEFLRCVLPEEGYKCAVVVQPTGAKWQKFFATHEELADFISVQDGLGKTTYHACASFKVPENDPPNTPRATRKLGRTHSNALAARAFWLDLDCGEGKPYADAEAGAQTIQNFCRSANLPAPVYVGSGYGLHVYWPLAERLDPEKWQGLAHRLRELCDLHGIAADHSRTTDISSILRTPGTRNRKHGAAKLVEWGGAVGPYNLGDLHVLSEVRNGGGPLVGLPRSNTRSRPSLVASALRTSIDEPRFAEPIAEQCAQLRELRRTGGQLAEPIWYAALGVLCYAEDGHTYAHQWSAGSPAYTFEETQERLERWKETAEGPATCAHFQRLNAKGCESCPFAGKITTPLQLGKHVAIQPKNQEIRKEAQNEIALPEGYAFIDKALVFETEGKNGLPANVLISQYPLYLRSVQTAEINSESFSLQFALELPNEPLREIGISARDFFSANGMSILAGKGAVIHDTDQFKNYVRLAVDKFNKDRRLEMQFEQFGWKEDESAFLCGANLYAPGSIGPAIGSPEIRLRSQYIGPARGGSLDGWSRAANALFASGCEPQAFALLASFAAPLMRFHSSGEGGAIVSLVNDKSGSGKTTALEAVASVWGREEGLKLTDDDTKVSKGLALGVLGNLPCIYDELYNRDPEIIRQFVLMFTNGRDKMRATQDGQIRHTKATWQTIMVLASNNSIVDILSSMDGTDAPAYRLLEFHTDIPKGVAKKGDELKRALKANSGYAGDAYLRYLVQPAVLSFVKAGLPKWTDEIWRKTELQSEHRFWVRTIASVAAAAAIVEKLGLLEFSPQRIVDWAIKQVTENGVDTSLTVGRDPAAMLSQYLNEHIGDMLVVADPWKPMTAVHPIMAPKRELHIRYELREGKIFVNEAHLAKWLVKKGVSRREFIKALGKKMVCIAEGRKTTLGAGTSYAGGQIQAVVFNGKHPAISGLLTEVPRVSDATASSLQEQSALGS